MYSATRPWKASMPNKLQQEIEDLLARLDTFPPRRPFLVRVRDGVAGWFRGLLRALASIPAPHPNAGHILLLAIAVIVIVYLAGPEGSDITRWIIAGAIVAFIAAFIFSLRKQSRPPEKLWRGKPMEVHGPGVGERLRSWFAHTGERLLGRRRSGR